MHSKFKTIIEPFRIKMVEPIKMTTLSERKKYLEEAAYNLFQIRAENILIDLLTDSGTGAMSAAQWGKMMEGDESYAGCKSFYDMKDAVVDLTGYKHVFPTHQGRAAERILFSCIGGEGKIILNNTHFDTTRANVEYTKAEAIDLVIDEGRDPSSLHPFKGNMDLVKLENTLKQYAGSDRVQMCMMTITNNSGGGQPVSMQNIRETKAICQKYKIPFFLDACRFAENAYFIKQREDGFKNKAIKQIVQEMFSYADGCTMSAKKDAIVNMGGFLAFNDDNLAIGVQNMLILTEGFSTYGGLSGRDLAALAQGLKEVVDEDYLEYRIVSTQYLGNALIEMGVPVVRPIGGHAVYIDAKAMLPHISALQYPGQALACALYLEGGIRSVEIGSFMFGSYDKKTGAEIPSKMELVRLAIPRRVYTQSHIDFVIEVIAEVNKNKNALRGYKVVEQPPFLRHFSAKLKKL
ncbi:MAG: tyrosine phenol-lyase [Bdellovibrionales bacterium RIFOXYD12_FULL_39_22]|nr:MAG: tyrosine phenol-lyase [Bdellovibrionales bacterium RIFOXYB1_FULL_39_21]OFZ40425.1 MAG: tyrosine phenol-lyase [Bdellovibrionales bacterium RIFOXYC12_FULL_39_17]OFZ49674.1 MAG: tyrosine phenol-lyase [Bdellovibrionales bacterium RIFOXYC1_FULL_39_130]OFZ77344.1 MAG: tyrosine phenol-lyase [Bdellovibrionales bacterium RIFOXYD1_FULL_39_84]OFZ95999.1 MAG: tyrosine phenol-lyase [Bdellovibrionales bacterium RIFOXYD12_FULL_39_22]HLE11261.1 tryptophanase [Bacteriovoracaceae bacterium]